MIESPEQQMQELKAEYERRIAELKQQTPGNNETSSEQTPVSAEHKAMSQTVEGMIQKEVPGFKASSDQPGHTNDDLPPEALDQVQQWVVMSFTKGPDAVIKVLKDSDPALIDQFHGALTGNEIFQKLVTEGKLQALK